MITYTEFVIQVQRSQEQLLMRFVTNPLYLFIKDIEGRINEKSKVVFPVYITRNTFEI